jgi:hypothetical protein
MRFRYVVTKQEYKEWSYWYHPPPRIKPDDLILDVGARDGDTAFWFFGWGYRNLRLVEPNPDNFNGITGFLFENCRELMDKGCKIEIRTKPFDLSDLDGVSFAKFDCEGCETAFDVKSEFKKRGIAWVMETHEPNNPDECGVYDYVMYAGYQKGDGLTD